MAESASTAPGRRIVPFVPAGIALALGILQLQILSLIYDYQAGLKPACLATLGEGACSLIGFAVPRALGVGAVLVLLGVARPAMVRQILSRPGRLSAGLPLNLAGFALLALPGLLLPDEVLGAAFVPLALAWAAGALLAGAGLLLMTAQAGAWHRLLVENGPVLGLLVVLGLLTPELARLLHPLWQVEAVADATFRAVAWLLGLAGYDVAADPATRVIRTGDFAVRVSPGCSGMEGFALVTLFLSIHLVLCRRRIAFPAAFLLYPVGIAAVWAFNVLRMSALLVIGIEGTPALAIGGFHSRAGWLAFTLLAFALILAARNVPALRRDGGDPRAAEA